MTGICGLVPIAIAAGITGLVQIRFRGQAGVGRAIGGLVAAFVWCLVGVLVIIAIALSSGDDGLGRVADAGSATVGSCLLEPTGDSHLARKIDCSQHHDAEVYLVEDLSAAEPWPGVDDVSLQADDRCYAAFLDYVGTSYEDSDYDYSYFTPDNSEWAAGEHRVVCVVLGTDAAELHGSVRQSVPGTEG